MEETTKAYLAGLFDGEGTITLSRKTANSQFRYPVLSISSTTLFLLELCKDTFGGHVSAQKVYKSHYKQSWSWKISFNSAINAIEALLPYCREPDKCRRMKLILDRYKQVTPRSGRYTPDMIQEKLAFEEEFFHPSNSIAIKP